MKILSLRLKNLNSLKGEWYIDFTDPAYQDSGIFAITGQTGAGKTTILDAICLALYGETPRIKTISGATNEIMTRQTGDCFAEISILINDSYYRCHWSQRRAHNKANGNLQDVYHSISQLNSATDDTGTILESKSKRCKKKIIDILGMDFEQFTRSVLLAQGQFAKFLTAKANDRANILEKITGTDIYGVISCRVHEKKRNNDSKLKELTATLDGIELLSAEQVSDINAELAEQSKQQSEQQQSIASLHQQCDWLSHMTMLTDTINKQQQQLDGATQAVADFAPDALRLQQATTAWEIEPDYQQLVHSNDLVKHQQTKQQSLEQILTTKTAQLATAQQQFTLASDAFIQHETLLHKTLPIIAQVRTLDNSIHTQQQLIESSQQHHQQQSQRQNALTQQIKHHQQQLVEQQQQLADINSYMLTHSNLASIAIDRDALNQHCVEIKALFAKQHELQSEQQALTAHRNDSDAEHIQLSTHEQQLTQAIHTHQQNAQTLDEDMSSLLSAITNYGISDWRNRLDTLKDRQQSINALTQQHEQLTQYYAQRDERDAQKQQVERTLSNQNKQYLAQQDTVKNLQERLADKQQMLSLQQQVIKLEEHIVSLNNEMPCPLCGATEHPYLIDLANGSHPHFDLNDNQHNSVAILTGEIGNLQQLLSIEETTQQQLHVSIAKLDEKLANISTEYRTLSTQIDVKIDALDVLINKLMNKFIDTAQTAKNRTQQQRLALIGQLNTENTADIDQCQQLIDDYERLSTQREAEQHQLNLHNTTLHETSTRLQTLLSDNKLYQEKIDNVQQRRDDTQANIQQQCSHINELLLKQQANTLSTFSINDIDVDDSDDDSTHDACNSHDAYSTKVESILAELRTISAEWLILTKDFGEKEQQQRELDKAISTLESTEQQLHTQLSDTVQQLANLNQQREQQQSEYLAYLSERQQLFADTCPTSEEQRLRALVQNAHTALTTAKETQQTLEVTINQSREELQEVSTDLTRNQQQQEKLQKAFTQTLTEQGFDDIDDFISARLDKTEREQLHNRHTELNTQLTQLTTLLASNQEALAIEQSKKLSDESLSVLQTRLQELESVHQQLAQDMGANKQKLADNAQKTIKFSSQHTAIEAQKRESNVWDILHTLIGSSDGKKFRNFAQGLTFDCMIKEANEQLRKMSDRYLLIRDDKEPLELNVIDDYQGSDVRSCKNLSGGETFIISLALALGLSRMSSQNTNVDSLFLDEGFGTLDEDSLDIALTTLTNLQQEGKLIGVISHIQALKDRILTQIKVDKLSGGVSQISGAGCGRVR